MLKKSQQELISLSFMKKKNTGKCSHWRIICCIVKVNLNLGRNMKLPKHTTHTYTHHTLNTHKTSQQFSYSLMSVCQTNVPQLLPYVPKYVPSLFHDGRLIDMAGSINYDLKLSTVLNSSFLCHRKKNTTFNYNTSNNMTDFFSWKK